MILLFILYIGTWAQTDGEYYEDEFYKGVNENYIDIWNEKINMEGKVCTKVN